MQRRVAAIIRKLYKPRTGQVISLEHHAVSVRLCRFAWRQQASADQSVPIRDASTSVETSSPSSTLNRTEADVTLPWAFTLTPSFVVGRGSFDEKEIKVRYALGVGRNDLKPPRSTRLFCRQV